MREGLFNFCHASAHNMIEWIFGVWSSSFTFCILLLNTARTSRHVFQLHFPPLIILVIWTWWRGRWGWGWGWGWANWWKGQEWWWSRVGWCWGKWTGHKVGQYCNCNVGTIHKQTYCTRAYCPWSVNKCLKFTCSFHLFIQTDTNIFRLQQHEVTTIWWYYNTTTL